MKIALMSIGLLITVLLFLVGRYFIKTQDAERSILFLSGDFSELNAQKICRVVGKRIKTWAIVFLLGSIIDFVKPGAGITTATVVFMILLVFHLADMTINRNKKYRA